MQVQSCNNDIFTAKCVTLMHACTIIPDDVLQVNVVSAAFDFNSREILHTVHSMYPSS